MGAIDSVSRPEVKATQFYLESMFPRKENIDDKFNEYFSVHEPDYEPVDLYKEVFRLGMGVS